MREDAVRWLLVDDSESDAELLRFQLEFVAPAVELLHAVDEAEAVRALDESGVRLVLVDVRLGEVDGRAVARELRNRSGARVVLWSGETGFTAGESMGFEVVEKPMDLDGFVPLIERLLADPPGPGGGA